MNKTHHLASCLTLLLGLLCVGSASAQLPPQQQREYVSLMQEYFEFSARYVEMAKQRETATYLAVEGITEIYEKRGEKARAIEHLQKILEASDDRRMRNVVRLKLVDLYNEFGRSDEALRELDAMIKDNE